MAHQLLARRLVVFEQRLFRGLLVTRALLPTAILVVVLTENSSGNATWAATAVWAALATWTVVTGGLLSNRLPWLRTMPVAVQVEVAVFVALVFFGVGARPWHLLHSFVPLAFVAIFVGETVAFAVAGSIVLALLAVIPVRAAWPTAPVQENLGVLLPVVVVAGAAILLAFVRRALEDVRRILAEQERESEAISRDEFAVALHDATAAVFREVSAPLGVSAAQVAELWATARKPAELEAGDQALMECLGAIQETLVQMEASSQGSSSVVVAIEAEVREIVSRTASVGAHTTLVASYSHEILMTAADAAALRRLITEAVVNARKYSDDGSVSIEIVEDGLRIANRAAASVRPRTGGMGRGAMDADAEQIGVDLSRQHADGRMVVRIGLPAQSRTVSTDRSTEIRDVLDRRRRGYLAALFGVRLVVAIVTAIVVQRDADLHRALLPALTATSIAFVLWNAVLIVATLSSARWLRIDARLALGEAGVIAVLVFLETGMASPWFSLTLGAIMLVAITAGTRAAFLVAGLLSVSLLTGYYLVRALGYADVGTTMQDMPFGWILNTFIYAVAAALGSSVGWVFARLGEGLTTYRRLLTARRAASYRAAAAEARVRVQRELHASLLQFVQAALVHLGDTRGDASWTREVERELMAMRDALQAVIVRLGAGSAA